MAIPTILKLTTVLSLSILLLLTLHPRPSFSLDFDDDEEEYMLDSPPITVPTLRSGSRFLSLSMKGDKIRKGAHCNPYSYNICNGISVNNGTGILHCCKTHCRNILRDWNNCGECGHRCRFGQRCCGGVCTDVMFSANHCGKCERQCLPGVKCEFGSCGYA